MAKQEPFSSIYKLPIELLVKIFDLLSLKDLHAACQTSKLWQEVAFYCYQQNYSATRTSNHNSDSLYKLSLIPDIHNALKLDAFISKIQNYYIEYYYSDLRCFPKLQSKFHMLSVLEFQYANLINIEIESMKEVLEKVEWLKISDSKIDGISIGNILTAFPNIKSLSLHRNNIAEYDWLIRKFPNLERIAFGHVIGPIPLAQFLRLNPNIRKLAVNHNLIFNNNDLIEGAPIILDELAINIFNNITKDSIHQLNELQEKGFYKRLKIYSFLHIDLDQETLDGMALINPIKLHFGDSNIIKLSSLRTIEELCAVGSRDIADLEETARSLENLQLIYFGVTTLSHVMPFIRQTRKLSKFRIDYLKINEKEGRQKQKIIDLSLMNSERSKLPNAEKVTLYVEEKLFLATKWAAREIDLDFIQLKRIESYYWDHDFDTYSDRFAFDGKKSDYLYKHHSKMTDIIDLIS